MSIRFCYYRQTNALLNQINSSLQNNILKDKSSNVTRNDYAGIKGATGSFHSIDLKNKFFFSKPLSRENTLRTKDGVIANFSDDIKDFSAKNQSLNVPFRNILRQHEAYASNTEYKANFQYEDGKQFFREAKRLLPFFKYKNFMQQIKLLNGGQKSKKEVIDVAEQVFSKENVGMLEKFKNLIYNSPLFIS